MKRKVLSTRPVSGLLFSAVIMTLFTGCQQKAEKLGAAPDAEGSAAAAAVYIGKILL